MRIIGKIDIDKYCCVAEHITTNEDIITDERIQHIKDRRPDDYERFCSYIPEIIDNPDYIIKAAKPNTAVLLKEIDKQGDKFKLVLRLKINDDPEGYKNSVLTFLRIGEKTWCKNLKNKIILYSRE